MQQIANARQAREIHTSIPTADNLIGLAFSGGGIRSATFNLGILQALAEKGLLHKFDYLSTVSGGGYIGSWLAAVTHRLLQTVPNARFRDVERALIPVKRQLDGREERTFLRWLRLYSNYLTPHTGLASGDTWAMLGTWLRNVFLNQTVLGLFFLGMFVMCDGDLLHFFFKDFPEGDRRRILRFRLDGLVSRCARCFGHENPLRPLVSSWGRKLS